MIVKDLVAEALQLRDQSLADIYPVIDLDKLPNPLPDNVCHLPDTILSEKEIRITSYNAPDLLVEIRSKRLSCVEVTKAFLRRAALAQHLVNCVTELLPTRALERAEYLDSLREPIGPLHGLPISVKEQHGMRGCANNGGFVAFVESGPVDVSGVNEVLWQAGAVFYARTTQPQSLMHLETSSNIYGKTLNPHNLNLTPGGSSGGESALIGLRGSVLGIGGDSGGSIRVPAANCGLYGFKPTTGRLSRRGARTVLGGSDGIQGAHGPISTTRSVMELLMKTYLRYEPWVTDNTLVPLPWRNIQLPKRLKIAIMWSDGVVKPHPPVVRALELVKVALEQANDLFQIVQWQPFDHDRAWRITQGLYFEDGGKALRKTMLRGNEKALPLTEWLLESSNVRDLSVEELCALKVERNKYRVAYNDLWLATGAEDNHPVDAILSPVGPGAAPPHGQSKYWSYTSQWNLLDYPAVVFPVTTVDPAVDQKEQGYVPLNAEDKWNYDLYDPVQYKQAPVGLQLITRRYEDERCLAILAAIERALGRE